MNEHTERFKKLAPKYPAASPEWLAGIIAGEGCVSPQLGEKCVTIANTDIGILCASIGALENLGILHWIVTECGSANSQCYQIKVARIEEIEKLKCLQLHHAEKQRKLESIHYEGNRKFTPQTLQRAKALKAEGMSQRKIAKQLNVSHATISNWLKRKAA